MFNLPILFIIFNRKDIALKSFDSIKRIKPSKLYIASDGPRETVVGEYESVMSTREAILKEIDWNCKVNTLFQSSNLGCGQGVFSAINWLFENEEVGIILEDDCIAQESFFQYALDMLNHYKDDQRIGMIAGTNPIDMSQYPFSIIFSKYKSCWGWATWRRAWKNMNIDMNWRNSPQKKDILSNCGYRGKDVMVWKYKIDCIDKEYVSAWDWQWYFSLAAQNQLCIYPKINLISNIGNDEQATHTSYSSITLKSEPILFPLQIPKFIVPCLEFDRKFYKTSQTIFSKASRIIPHRIKQIIKKTLK